MDYISLCTQPTVLYSIIMDEFHSHGRNILVAEVKGRQQAKISPFASVFGNVAAHGVVQGCSARTFLDSNGVTSLVSILGGIVIHRSGLHLAVLAALLDLHALCERGLWVVHLGGGHLAGFPLRDDKVVGQDSVGEALTLAVDAADQRRAALEEHEEDETGEPADEPALQQIQHWK